MRKIYYFLIFLFFSCSVVLILGFKTNDNVFYLRTHLPEKEFINSYSINEISFEISNKKIIKDKKKGNFISFELSSPYVGKDDVLSLYKVKSDYSDLSFLLPLSEYDELIGIENTHFTTSLSVLDIKNPYFTKKNIQLYKLVFDENDYFSKEEIAAIRSIVLDYSNDSFVDPQIFRKELGSLSEDILFASKFSVTGSFSEFFLWSQSLLGLYLFMAFMAFVSVSFTHVKFHLYGVYGGVL